MLKEQPGTIFIGKLLLALMAVFFLIQFVASFGWRQYLDTPLLNYAGFLINDCGRIPYQEVFETSMPGTLWFHSFLGSTIGYSDLAMRVTDSFFLGLTMLMIFFIIKPFSRLQGIFAALLFALVYLGMGAKMALQRDFIGAMLISMATFAVLINRRNHENIGLPAIAAAGFLSGMAASFKPQMLVFLLPLVWYCHRPGSGIKGFLPRLATATFAALTSFSLPLFWVWNKGGWPAFVDIFTSYLPLHTQIGHDFTLVQWPEKIIYSLSGLFVLNDHLILLLLALSGAYISLRQHAESSQREIVLFSLLAATAFIYPAISGQFWFYHWAPFLLFASLAASFCFNPSFFQNKTRQAVGFILALALVFQLHPAPEFLLQIKTGEISPQLSTVAEDLSAYLNKTLKPGETVQPLDWVNGSIHALLKARVPIATKFLYDYHFFHHLSNPYIKKLKQEFLQALTKSPPDYIIFVFVKSRVMGPDTSQEFPELGQFIFANYKLIFQTQEFGIFHRKSIH